MTTSSSEIYCIHGLQGMKRDRTGESCFLKEAYVFWKVLLILLCSSLWQMPLTVPVSQLRATCSESNACMEMYCRPSITDKGGRGIRHLHNEQNDKR